MTTCMIIRNNILQLLGYKSNKTGSLFFRKQYCRNYETFGLGKINLGLLLIEFKEKKA